MDIDAILNLFKCEICKKLFDVPKHFQCNHDVCEKCLQTHIIRTVPMSGYDLQEYVKGEKVEVKPLQDFFVCPADGCDKQYTVPYPEKNTITWASQINNCIRRTHFIELFHGKRQNDTKFCEVCINSPNHIPATVVCTDCLRLYCNKCTFIHRHVNPAHKLIDVVTFENASTIVKTKSSTERNPDCETDVTQLENLTIHQIVKNNVASITEREQKTDDQKQATVSPPDVCPIHSPCERVLFCKDCKVICCVKCSDTIHASCRNVHSIQTLNKKVQSVREDQTLKVRVESVLEKCLISINKYTTYETNEIFDTTKNDELDNKVTDARDDICVFVVPADAQKLISAMLSKLELIYNRGKRCIVQLDSLNPRDTCKFIQIIFSVEKECMELQEEFLKVMGSDSDLDVNIRTIVKEHRSKMKTGFITEGSEDNKSVAKKDVAFDQYLHQFKLEMEEDLHHLIDASADIELETRIFARSRSDTSDCWFTDCVLLRNMDIVVADHANKKVKLIDKNQEICEIGLESSPLGIAVNEEEQMCYVTLNEQTKIILLAIRNGQLIVCSEIETHTNMYGIAIMDTERLLVTNTGHKDGPVCIINRDGKIENVNLQESYPKKKLYVKPIHVKVSTNIDAGRVYVSDFQRNGIVSYKITYGLNSLLTEPIDGKLPCNSKSIEQDEPEGDNSISVSLSESEDARINSKDSITEDDNSDSKQKVFEQPLFSIGSIRSHGVVLDLLHETMISYPTGFDVDSMGNIFVCCNAQCQVLKLDKDGNRRSKLLEVSQPRALSLHGDRLILTVDTGPRKNYVMMYQLKPAERP